MTLVSCDKVYSSKAANGHYTGLNIAGAPMNSFLIFSIIPIFLFFRVSMMFMILQPAVLPETSCHFLSVLCFPQIPFRYVVFDGHTKIIQEQQMITPYGCPSSRRLMLSLARSENFLQKSKIILSWSIICVFIRILHRENISFAFLVFCFEINFE